MQDAESRWRVPTEDFDVAAGLEVAVRDAKAVTSWDTDHHNNVLWTGATHPGPAPNHHAHLRVRLAPRMMRVLTCSAVPTVGCCLSSLHSVQTCMYVIRRVLLQA